MKHKTNCGQIPCPAYYKIMLLLTPMEVVYFSGRMGKIVRRNSFMIGALYVAFIAILILAIFIAKSW